MLFAYQDTPLSGIKKEVTAGGQQPSCRVQQRAEDTGQSWKGLCGRRNTCKVRHVAAGQARKLGSQSVAVGSNKTGCPRRIKRNKKSCGKT